MKTQIARILSDLAALVAAVITAQAQDNQPGSGGAPSNPAPGDTLHGVHYTWTTLDDPLATDSTAVGFGTFAVGIFGNVIVGGYVDTSGNAHGFVYDDKNTTWTTLDDPEGVATLCYNISDDGIIGIYADASGNVHGFFYNGRTWTSLDAPLAALGTFPTGIQGHRIVGEYADANSVYHGFLYDAGSQTWTTLDDPLAGTAPDTILGQGTSPQDIQGDLIVGSYTDSDFVYHGFLYNIKDKSWVTLDDPSAGSAPGQGTGPNGISGGVITGISHDSGGVAHGFVYDGRTWTTLDAPLAGTTSGQGTFVQYSWAGQIVGWYVDSTGLSQGFIATPAFGPH